MVVMAMVKFGIFKGGEFLNVIKDKAFKHLFTHVEITTEIYIISAKFKYFFKSFNTKSQYFKNQYDII